MLMVNKLLKNNLLSHFAAVSFPLSNTFLLYSFEGFPTLLLSLKGFENVIRLTFSKPFKLPTKSKICRQIF